MYRIIFAIGGFLLLKNFWGFILGLFIGGLFDIDQKRKSGGTKDLFEFYQQRSSSYDIATMLMALSASVMKADGKVLKSELDFVKSFFQLQFGNRFQKEHLQVLKRFLDSNHIPLDKICQDIRYRMQSEVRVQLIHYLFGIAKADGDVSVSEINQISHIAQLLGVSNVEFESIKNMFYRNTESDYKILGINSSAEDNEVKKAYRKMAVKFHPDKVASMGEQYQKGAKEKFQKIQDAYEAIKKQRGFK
ncbi:MAG: molecular chaperone DnaJ [Crocinitomicaceae bacterium]|nr:molecular chaperone DnaJ [Crocinitomicaceae bacterium]